MAQPTSLADGDSGLINWLRSRLPQMRPTAERPQNANIMQEIQRANPNMPPMEMAPNPQPAMRQPLPPSNPYSVEYMIREAQNNAPKYDRLGNRIR